MRELTEQLQALRKENERLKQELLKLQAVNSQAAAAAASSAASAAAAAADAGSVFAEPAVAPSPAAVPDPGSKAFLVSPSSQ
jgi:septal ring factor EnvC (AmiA/AmiB activator)